jgi:hypothetical protein
LRPAPALLGSHVIKQDSCPRDRGWIKLHAP